MSVATIADKYILKDGQRPGSEPANDDGYVMSLLSRVAVLEGRIDELNAENADLRSVIRFNGLEDELDDISDHILDVADEDLTLRERLGGRKLKDVLDYNDRLEIDNIRLSGDLGLALEEIVRRNKQRRNLAIYFVCLITIFSLILAHPV